MLLSTEISCLIPVTPPVAKTDVQRIHITNHAQNPSFLANVEVSVTGGEKDYSSKFSLGVFRGRLALMNRTPGGMVLYVR